MTEEELERLMQSFNTQMQGIGGAGAAGARGVPITKKYWSNSNFPEPGNIIEGPPPFLNIISDNYYRVDEQGNRVEGLLDWYEHGLSDGDWRLKEYENMTPFGKWAYNQGHRFAQDSVGEGIDWTIPLLTLLQDKIPGLGSLIPNLSTAEDYKYDVPVEDAFQPNAVGDPIYVLPEQPVSEPSPGNPHKDKPVDFNLSDWLNENVPPLEPAPEPPDPEMYKPPHWTEGLGEKDERTGKYNTNVGGPQSWRRDGEQQVGNLDYYNLTQDLIGEGSLSPYITPDWAKKRLGNPIFPDQWTYKPGVTNSMVQDHYNDWLRSNVPTIHSDQEKQWQQAVDESQIRYDEMVAEMVEAERVRQEEFAAKRQRYTDMYNENPDFYENLFSGGGSSEWSPLSPFPSDETYSTEMDRHPGQEGWKGLDDFWNALGAVGPALSNLTFPGDYAHRLDPSVGQPIIPVNSPISQEEIILNQSKPGAYIYPPGMSN